MRNDAFIIALAVWVVLAAMGRAMPAGLSPAIHSRAATDKLVFAHFMIGIVSDRKSSADYDMDMIRAKQVGIDAFALNIGVDPYTDQQLLYAYQSAAKNGISCFISFDFNWWTTAQASTVGAKIAQYATQPSQLKVGGKVFVSSFAGDDLDVAALRAAAGVDIFFAPNFHPSKSNFGSIDGALNWMGWDSNGNNKAPGATTVSVSAGDQEYLKALAGKPYIAPVSPWFFTHYGPEVSYSKNWIFPSDLLWFNRWKEILTLAPQYLEIITWNDYGESHYVGSLASPHYDDGGSKWVNDMPHDGWLDMAMPFIAAFKAGAQTVDAHITTDQVVYWHRRTLKSLDCDATDTCMVSASNGSGNYFMGRPDGSQHMADSVFAVTLLKSAGQLTITSGGNSKTFDAPAGATSFTLDMATGKQSFAVSRGGAQVAGLSGTSLMDVADVCPCGLYNLNAFVGMLPAISPALLAAEGLVSLTEGLHVQTCKAQPSLSAGGGTGPVNPNPNLTTGSATGWVTTTSTTATSTTSSLTTSSHSITQQPPATLVLTAPGGCSTTITASAQLAANNCLPKGSCWAGPAEQDSPDFCDG